MDDLFGTETRVYKARLTGTLEQLGKATEVLRAIEEESGCKVEVLEWHKAKAPRAKPVKP